MVLDQAGWQGSAALVVSGNITLAPLPPYSPELKPVSASSSTFKEEPPLAPAARRLRRHRRGRLQAWNRLVARLAASPRSIHIYGY
jgi:hypothetical protein